MHIFNGAVLFNGTVLFLVSLYHKTYPLQIYTQIIFAVKDRLNLVQSQYREELHKYTTGIFRTANYKIHKAVYMPRGSGLQPW